MQMDLMDHALQFMPHGMCLLWRPELMLLHIGSDTLIALSYFAIPFGIAAFVRARSDLQARHRALALLFAVFIFLCGMTHVFSIITLWYPIYISEGVLKALTAAASVATAIVLMPLVPRLLEIPSPRLLQLEVDAHRKTVADLEAARAELRRRVDLTEGELAVTLRRLEQSNALLRTIVETGPGPIYAKDADGRMLLANRATLELIGKPWEAVEGRTDAGFIDDASQAASVMRHDRQVMDTGVVRELEEVVVHPKKGARIWLSTRAPMRGEDGQVDGVVGMSFDITERKELEAKLLHVSRLSAMGEMATALAHELNQPLTSVVNYIDVAQRHLETPEPSSASGALQKASDQALRAGQIIRRLRSFVSTDDFVRRPENLAGLLDEAGQFALLGAANKGVVLRYEHADPSLEVLVDRIQIEQVVHNLVRNAVDALNGMASPTVVIRTEVDPADCARVSIIDNGPGVDPEVRQKLFDPFFSTKGHQGMGVGLSICRTIVEAHGGRIWFEPVATGGSIFLFTLPLSGGEPLPAEAVHPNEKAPPRRSRSGRKSDRGPIV